MALVIGGTTVTGTQTLDATKLTGNLPAISEASLTGITAGITSAQQWRLNSTYTGDADPISSNLEEADTDGYGRLGGAMTVSSGIWTFPSTGIWLISFTAQFSNNGDSRTNQIIISSTTNNSSYSQSTLADQGIAHSQNSHTYANGNAYFIFDVTNVSTHKVKFATNVNDDSSSTYGESDVNRTHFTFIRLGDT